MKIGDRARLTLAIILLLLTAGCVIRKPAQAMYCEHKAPDGKHCQVWARHPYPCVHEPGGSCTEVTK